MPDRTRKTAAKVTPKPPRPRLPEAPTAKVMLAGDCDTMRLIAIEGLSFAVGFIEGSVGEEATPKIITESLEKLKAWKP